MVFVHLSHTQIQKIKTPRQLGKGYKPQGSLWFACGNAWEEWMSAEGFQPKEPYKYKYEATLDTEMLLILKTIGDIQTFSEKYAIPDTKYRYFFIDWNKVKRETGKSGIYILNGSLKTARKKFPWYSTFDACSIAIWNKDAVRSMVEIKL